MSERGHEQRPLTPDERYELSLASDASARRNRPSHLVVFAGLFFIVSCAALGFTSCRAGETAADLDKRVSQRDTIAGLLAEFEALETSASADDSDVGEVVVNFLSKMEEIAEKAGVKGKLPFPREKRTQDVVGAVRVTYDYTIKGETLEPLLSFMKDATGEIPGLHVAGLAVRPRNNQWELDAKFERWERISQP